MDDGWVQGGMQVGGGWWLEWAGPYAYRLLFRCKSGNGAGCELLRNGKAAFRVCWFYSISLIFILSMVV
jgi:hypothetical protein